MKSDKLLDAIGEISEEYIREAAPGSRRARPWLGTAITAAAAVLIIGVAAVAVPRLTLHPEPAPPVIEEPVAEVPVPAQIGEEPVTEVPVPAQTGEEPVGETLTTPPPAVAPLGPIADEAVGEGPAGPVENENILWYHALTLTAEAAAFDPPETVELGVFRDAVFTEEEIDAVVQRLLDTGWEDMTSTNYDGKVVFFSQPEKDPMAFEEAIAQKQAGEVYTVTERDVERARQFIADSGLDALIYEETGVELRQEADMTSSVLLFYGYYNGMKTNTYVRMSFYENGDLAEAKLYAVAPETETVPALPLEEALQNAYGLILYGGGDNYDPHTVTAVRLEYVDGLPYYILTLDEMLANGPREIRALAVDLSLIEADEDLRAQWERQLDMP